MKPLALAIFSLMAASAVHAASTNYVLVVPVAPYKSTDIQVGLQPLPRLELSRGDQVTLDLSQLALTGNAIRSKVAWNMLGALPQGVSMAQPGRIAGTANESGSFTVQVTASYRGVQAAQSYGIDVAQIQLQLSIPEHLTKAVAGQAYSLDLKQYASITGDSQSDIHSDQLTWAIASGTFPGGLSLSSDGVLSGTPTGIAGSPVSLSVAYKGVQAQAAAGVPVDQAIVADGGSRQWSDGTIASTCKGYRNPAPGYAYSGAIGNGTYKIKPGSQALDVYCDMQLDGGGWTLVLLDDFRGMFPEIMGVGTSRVCASLTDGCRTQGTSSIFKGTAHVPKDYAFKMWLGGVTAPASTEHVLNNAANYVRGNITAPGATLYSLMTDTYMGWAHPGNTSADPSDQNLVSNYYYGSGSEYWSDGNWHGCPKNTLVDCGTHPYQAGGQVAGASGLWGNHFFPYAPTYLSATDSYRLGSWSYYGVGDMRLFGTESRIIPRVALEPIRWGVMVR